MAEKTLPVKMLVSIAGEGFGYTVGEQRDLPEAMAIAFCTLPEDGPRATPVGWALAADGATRQTATAPGRSKATTSQRKTAAAPPAPTA